MKKRKLTTLLLATAVAMSISACGGNAATSAEPNKAGAATESVKEDTNKGPIEVDEKLLTVDITLPKAIANTMSDEDIQATVDEYGIKSYKRNDDGSLTYTMSKSTHKKLTEDMKASMEETINSLCEGEDAVDSFVKIEYNDDLSKIDVYVDSASYTMWDSLYMLTFYISGSYYQSLAGVSADDMDVVVTYINNETKEVIQTGSYKEYIKNASDSAEETVAAQEAESSQAQNNYKELAFNETVTVENECEFFVEFADITTDVMPPSPAKWYSHYEAEKGKAYADVCVSYKNLNSSDIDADDTMTGKLLYGNKYEFTGFSIIEEDNRGDFTYANITSISPLSKEYVHYLFEIPEEAMNSSNSMKAFLTIGEETYSVLVREGDDTSVGALNENAVLKTEGSVVDKEVVAIPGKCEFAVDYAAITDDVMPPNPDSWYSHYEADDGKTYVDLCFEYKNWEEKKVGADDLFTAELIYDGNYKYKGFAIIEEDNRSDFTYANITSVAPLTKEYIHMLFEVPEEIGNSDKAVDISFKIYGNSYNYKVR